MHNPKVVGEFDHDEDLVKTMLKKSIHRRKFGTKRILEIRTLKKLIKNTDIERTSWMSFRLSKKEKKMLQSKAKTRELEVSDYVRMKLFT